MYIDHVLRLGGYSGDSTYTNTVEIYDQISENWCYLPEMSESKCGMASVLGPSGEATLVR